MYMMYYSVLDQPWCMLLTTNLILASMSMLGARTYIARAAL